MLSCCGRCWTLKKLLSCPGIGGNLVAIQSSRISTHLHFHCAPGEVPDETKGCYYPCRTFCGTGQSCEHRPKAGTSRCEWQPSHPNPSSLPTRFRSQSSICTGAHPPGGPWASDLPVHHPSDEEWAHDPDAHLHVCLPGYCSAAGELLMVPPPSWWERCCTWFAGSWSLDGLSSMILISFL